MLSLKLYLNVVFLIVSVIGESPYNYHGRIGIKKAEELMKEELFSRIFAARIIGGSQVSQSNHIAHQAGLVVTLTSGWTSVCGGALVSNARVLTAAHCWYDGRNQGRQFTVVLGSTTLFTGGTRLVTTKVTMHPSWNTMTMTHDIAMARIPSLTFTNLIQPVALPTVEDANEAFDGVSAQVSGYGKTSDAQSTFPTTTSLQQTSVTLITNAECQQSFSFDLHVGHICSSGKGRVGTCDGDSGGPLTAVRNNRRTLIGIVSFGPDRCEAGLPSVFTRVTAFIPWIKANL